MSAFAAQLTLCQLSLPTFKGVVSVSSQFRSFWNLRPSRNENPSARNARQFAITAKRKFCMQSQHLSMKTTVMVLLTNDNELEDAVAEALLELGGVSHLTRDAGHALETVCGVHDLDLAVIDFEHGPHGMTLLSAISILRGDLPIIVITHDDEKHVEALAYTNGATACFSKPASTTQLVASIREFCGPRVEQALA